MHFKARRESPANARTKKGSTREPSRRVISSVISTSGKSYKRRTWKSVLSLIFATSLWDTRATPPASTVRSVVTFHDQVVLDVVRESANSSASGFTLKLSALTSKCNIEWWRYLIYDLYSIIVLNYWLGSRSIGGEITSFSPAERGNETDCPSACKTPGTPP